MAFVKNLFDKNFLEYASYVIKDRAIPDLEDGLKPVQRRIMHTLFNIDDGRMHKVAGVVGECMKYHPHGDMSIGGALVTLANKEVFIEKQGNFGNVYTGDGASASRYIECRVHPLAKDFLYNPHITQYVDSYDGRGKEPVVFRAKLPVALISAAEGIAVGMSTKILPYNIRELIDAEIKALKGEDFEIYPDVPTGGLIDVSNYNDGNGKLVTRARLDMRDEKKIIITELPVDTNSRELLDSIESAYKAGKIKISSIEDFTTDHCEIEINLPRGVYSKDVEKSLYAYTDCEKSVNCQMLVIKDNMPVCMSATDIVKYYAGKLTSIIKDELEYERGTLLEELHARTLERIFIEERIYKAIEQMKTEKAVFDAVKSGFKPFSDELVREISDDDVKKLLQIPIRRISLFDIKKNRDQVAAINKRLKEISRNLKHLKDCAVSYLETMKEKFQNLMPEILERKTEISKFETIDVKKVVKRDIALRYDEKGYLGKNVSGGVEVLRVTPYDRIFVVRKSGIWGVCDVPDKLFVDTGMWYVNYAEKEVINRELFTIIYRDVSTRQCYIKRCRVSGWIMNRNYMFVPDNAEVLHVDTRDSFKFTLKFEKKARQKLKSLEFDAGNFEEKGLKAGGVRLDVHEVESISVEKNKDDSSLF